VVLDRCSASPVLLNGPFTVTNSLSSAKFLSCEILKREMENAVWRVQNEEAFRASDSAIERTRLPCGPNVR